jgi:hypothetical protein
VAFGEWTEPFFERAAWKERNRQLRAAMSQGATARKTVVAASRFVHPQAWRVSTAQRRELLGREFQSALDLLNDYIVTLSLVRGDPSLVARSR